MAEQQRDVIEILEHDHREVEDMFKELESLRGATSDDELKRRKDLADQVTIELVRHSVAEEVLVYPKVEDERSTPKPTPRMAAGGPASLFDRMRDLATGRGTDD
jgi:hemerythrin superfamily protein